MPKKILALHSTALDTESAQQTDEDRTAAALGGRAAPPAIEDVARVGPRWNMSLVAGGILLALFVAGVVIASKSRAKNGQVAVLPQEIRESDVDALQGARLEKGDALASAPGGGLAAPAPQAALNEPSSRKASTNPQWSREASAAPMGPMIARTVSFTILAKDLAAARTSLDSMLARHHGYSASLAVNTPANGPGSFQASLRIPADEVTAALTELKALGRVLAESQSGEEVTQQHADLVARLANSRQEETRLRAILEQRTGKIEDVLQVEEEIARVRGQIEQMEAEQNALEHRVDFVTVDLQILQEYREQLAPAGASSSAATELRNAFVAGLRHAGGTILGILLFVEEFGPALLIWIAILGAPAFFVIRRYRRMQRQA